MKPFKGKAIYQPAGKAAEYSEWACNFYTGCSADCEYCYLKKGRGVKVLGGNVPTLKKHFKDGLHAIKVFEKELLQNIFELRYYGLFFSFTTDPLLIETIKLTDQAISICLQYGVPVKILTKQADWTGGYLISNGNMFVDFPMYFKEEHRRRIAFGFTLTGHDELEPCASTNVERIEAMKKLHDAGFRTFASIEPIILTDSSAKMIMHTIGFCDLYKVGLMSGQKYDWRLLRSLIMMCSTQPANFYFKDSFLKQACVERANLPDNCVGRYYELFDGK